MVSLDDLDVPIGVNKNRYTKLLDWLPILCTAIGIASYLLYRFVFNEGMTVIYIGFTVSLTLLVVWFNIYAFNLKHRVIRYFYYPCAIALNFGYIWLLFFYLPYLLRMV